MRCKKFKPEDLLLYFYGELDSGTRKLIEKHLTECKHCENFIRRQKALADVMDKSRLPEVSPLILDRLNKQILDRIVRGDMKVRGKDGKSVFSKVINVLYYPFSKPAYAFSTLLVVFVAGLIIGKIWMSSSIINDPGILVGLIESRSEMSREEKDYIKKLVAGYFLGSKELEVKELKKVDSGDMGNSRVLINFEVKKEMNLSGGLDDPVILNVLRYSALYDRDPEKRARATRMLYLSKRLMENKEIFLAVLLNDRDYKPRYQALEAVDKLISDNEVREALKKVLLNDPDERIRGRALEILSRIKDENLVPIFALVAYRDSCDTLRAKAKKILDGLYSEGGEQ